MSIAQSPAALTPPAPTAATFAPSAAGLQPGRTTLSKFLIQQLSDAQDQGRLAALLVDVAAAVKAISAMTAKGALGGFLGALEQTNVQG